MKCNCRQCQEPIVRMHEDRHSTVVGICYQTVNGMQIVGIGEETERAEDELKNYENVKRKRRLKSTFKALKSAGKETAKLGLQHAIPGREAVKVLQKINRTKADLETLADLGVNDQPEEPSVEDIDGFAYKLYKGI